MRYFIILIILILSTTSASAAEKSVILDQAVFRLFYDTDSNLIFLVCGDEVKDELTEIRKFSIRIIDPNTLGEISNFDVDYCPSEIMSCDNGQNILIGFSELRRKSFTGNIGILRKYDRGTGKIVAELTFDKSVDLMVIDNARKYAYLKVERVHHQSYGKKEELAEPHLICKIDLDSFEVVAERAIYMEWSFNMAITPDDKRLFLDLNGMIGRLHDGIDALMLCIYRTDDLSLINTMILPEGYPSLVMSGNGRLYVSISADYPRSTPTLHVIDTDKCEIIDSHHYGIVEFSSLLIDDEMNKLYCTTSQPVKYENEWGSGTALEPSNKLMIVDLDDYSAETISIGESPFFLFAVIPKGDKRRLFLITDEGKKLQYYDY